MGVLSGGGPLGLPLLTTSEKEWPTVRPMLLCRRAFGASTELGTLRHPHSSLHHFGRERSRRISVASLDAFYTSHVAGDPDCPTPGMSSIADAIQAIQMGKMVVVVDSEDRENEGDLILAAEHATPQNVAFMLRHCSGLICASLPPPLLDHLQIPLMLPPEQNSDTHRTAYSLPVDAAVDGSGISAAERAHTLRLLACPEAHPEAFRKPGHVFPLRSHPGGVVGRPGHTEAAGDLAILAGLAPVGVLCELMHPSGRCMRLPALREFAADHSLPLISIADLIRYRSKRESGVRRTAVARLPTPWGNFQAVSFHSCVDGLEHMAMVMGEVGGASEVLVRVQRECVAGLALGSTSCACGRQLHHALEQVAQAGRGAVLLLRAPSDGLTPLMDRAEAEAVAVGGEEPHPNGPAVDYGAAAEMLKDLRVVSARVMSNEPHLCSALEAGGVSVTEYVPAWRPS